MKEIFMFWWARRVAEFVVGLSVLVVCALVVLFIALLLVLWQRAQHIRSRRRRRKQRE